MKFVGFIFKTFILSLLVAGQVNFAYAQTASILPPAETTFFDANGNPLAGGNVTFSIPGTTTPKTTWQDAAETIPNANPVVLDSAGRALILGSGSYRQIVKDQHNNLIWDQVTASPGSSGGGGGSTVGDGLAVGTVLAWTGLVAPANYIFATGEAINRVTFSALFAAITQVQSITCVGGSPILNNVADTSQLPIGAAVEASCIPSGSNVVSTTANTVTINQNAMIGLTVNATFFPFGNGDLTSTFNVPDLRGRTLVGRNNMGGATSTALSAAFYDADPNALGALGGAQANQLATSNLPPYTPSGSVSTTTLINGGSGAGTPQGLQSDGVGPVNTGGSGSGGTNVTLSAASTSGFTGNPQGGTSSLFSIVQPSDTVNYIIKVSPDTSISVATIGQLSPGTPNQLAGTDANGTWGNVTVPTGLTVASRALNFNIPALPIDSSPNANNNFVIEYNAAGNATNRVSLGQIATSATAGVQTYNGITGNVGGINIQTSNYTISNTDCEKTVEAGTGTTGFLTITLPVVASGFPASCKVTIKNGDVTRGKKLSGFPSDFSTSLILWPLQTGSVQLVNGSWVSLQIPGPWILSAATKLLVDNISGSDTANDCLGLGTAACATATHAAQLFCADMIKNRQTFIIDATASSNLNETVTLCPYRQTEDLAQGTAAQIEATIVTSSGNAVVAVGVNTPWEFVNSTFEVPSNATCVEADINSLIYLNNPTFFTCSIAMQALFGGKIEISGGVVTLRSNIPGGVVQTSQGGIFIGAALPFVCNGIGVVGAFTAAADNSIQNWAGTTFSGCSGVTGTRFSSAFGGGIQTGGGGANFFPGNAAGTATSPGWYN